MPAISSGALALWAAGATVVGSAANAGIQASTASKSRKQQKQQQKSAEDRATIESEQVQAASNLEEADIAFESEASKADSKAASAGSRLLVGRGKKKAKSGVKL